MDRFERATALAGCPVLEPVPAAALLVAADRAAAVGFAAGAAVPIKTEDGDVVLVIVRGRVRFGTRELGPGALVGELAAVDDEVVPAPATAIDEVVVIRLFRDDFLDLLAEHPSAARALAAVLSARIRHGMAP
jgi:CRP-like cAMP-binding protein